MNLPTETFGNVMVVHTPEELGGDQAEKLVETLTSLPHQRLVLDVDRTEGVDSEGLTALLDAHEALRGVGGDLKIATTSGTNRTILEITRLDRQIEVYESVIDAVKSYR